MNIKTRLLLYNILIILFSSILIIMIFNYIESNSSKVLYNVKTATVDENADVAKLILSKNSSYDYISINLQKYNYDLSVYENNKLIYGTKNNSLEKLIKNYYKRINETKTLFIDNSTIIMKVEDNKILFAVNKKDFSNSFLFYKTPNHFQTLLSKIIFLILCTLIIILFLAVFFSRRILKRVMKPLNLLEDGAERIQNGDYNQKIIYEHEDEFTPVISNFNEMQESLKEKTEKTKIYEKAKKDMINGISHDIRTPLTVVKGNIKGIQDGVASTKDKRKKYLDVAYNRVIDIENLLNRLFDTFNYETKEIKLNKEKVDISNYIKEIINSNENIINGSVKANMKLLENKEVVYIDKLEFKRIFDNLINNAIKHNKEKENLVLDINIWKENNLCKISFKDNGKGVKKENLDYIFDEFFKEDLSRNSDKSGSGLGLFIVKKIVESHNGTIVAKNKKGLYFEITLKGE